MLTFDEVGTLKNLLWEYVLLAPPPHLISANTTATHSYHDKSQRSHVHEVNGRKMGYLAVGLFRQKIVLQFTTASTDLLHIYIIYNKISRVNYTSPRTEWQKRVQ